MVVMNLRNGEITIDGKTVEQIVAEALYKNGKKD